MDKKIDFNMPLKLSPVFIKEKNNWGKPFNKSEIIKQISCLYNSDQKEIDKEELKKNGLSQDDSIAERWIGSDSEEHPSNVSFFNNEIILPFNKLLERFGESILGKEHLSTFGTKLSAIMKQIDTNEVPCKGSLSVKIHSKPGHLSRPVRPKIWKGKGSIYLGWKRNMTKELIYQGIKNGTLEKDMNLIELDPGRPIVIPGSTVFALRHNTFIYEWTNSPWEEKIDPLDPAIQTVSFYDRTDGKISKRQNEDIEGGIEILKTGDGFSEYKEIKLTAKEIFKDSSNNKIILLAETPEIFIEQISVLSSIEMSTAMRGFPVYLEQGAVEISTNNQKIDEMLGGEERFFPSTLGQFTITAKKVPSTLLKWYAPFPWMIET